MKKILISGYYGFNNIGDEAILKVMISDLEKKIDLNDVIVLSNNPTQTESDLSVKAINRSSIFHVINSIRKCDVLLSGGGSLLQDGTSRLSIYYYLFIYFIAMMFRKKIIIFSHGIGPINHKRNKKLISFVFKRVARISVRDNESKEELVSYGIKENSIYVTADPVISYEGVTKEYGKEILLSYDSDFDFSIPTIGFALKAGKTSCIKSEVVKAIDKLKGKRKCNIVLVPFHFTEDLELINDIKNMTKNEVIVIDNKYSVEKMFSLISYFDVMVAVRLHALIFSAVVGVPLVGISYDPKIDAFLNSVCEKSISDIEKLKSDAIVSAVEHRINNKEKIVEELYKSVLELKAKLNQYNDNIESYLE